MRQLLVFGVFVTATALASEQPTVAVIEAAIDGEAVRWESFDTEDGPGAMWRNDGSAGTLTVGGLEATGADPRDASWRGSQIAISVQFPLESRSVHHRVLAAAAGGGASIQVIPEAGELTRMLILQEGSVQMTRGPLDGDALRFEGRFSGTLVDGEGRPAARVADGRFVVEKAVRVRL